MREGRLATGEALPTVRALAARLGTSPATVNAAYRLLRERGLVVAQGRRGTRVAPRPPLRSTRGVPPAPEGARDLSTGLPDPGLLPALGPALAALELESRLRFSELETDDAELLELASSGFAADGLSPGAVAIVGGAFDGVDRVLESHLRPGDRVIIEDPAYSFIRDLLLARGLTAVPVGVDDSGLLPEPFAAALARGVEAVAIVPRAQNPYGAALDPERASVLRRLLEPHPDVLLIEDDHAGVVSGAPFSSLVTTGSRRWAVIRATSKFLHPDLRLALMASDETTIARVEGRRALGSRWVSHVLQAAVAQLLRDPQTQATVLRARDAYACRRAALLEALSEHGIAAHGRSGLNVWVPVREEGPVVRALLDAGWLVLAGERFRIASSPGIRVTVATLEPGEAGEIADVIAAVARAGRSRGAY